MDSDEDPDGDEDCWGSDPHTWQVEQLAAAMLEGDNPHDPTISSNGLLLTYVAGPADARAVYQATRLDRASPWNALQLVAWPEVPQLGFPAPLGEDELVVVIEEDLWLSMRQGRTWSTPTPMAALNTPTRDSLPSFAAKVGRLLFTRGDGPHVDALGGPGFRLVEAERAPEAAPGTAFGNPRSVALGLGAMDIALCPAISADGLHLFFGTNHPDPITADNIDHVLRIAYTERASLDAGWAAPEVLDVLASNVETCSSSVTADGCELYFHRFTLGATSYEMFVATRTP